jgi:hypothetical protein
MIIRHLLSVTYLLLLSLCTYAQDKSPYKYGKVEPEDFKTTVYSIDSSANAVVIAHIGSTELVGNTKGWFSLEYKVYKRVHILNKNGYDIADVKIQLYSNGQSEEKLDKLKATTYNLENGKVVTTKLETKSGLFKDKLSKNHVSHKFTFPNVKEGSIIEYEYQITSDFLFNLQPWEFQGSVPRLWSEYNVSMPQFFHYVTLVQGYQPFHIRDQKSSRENYTVSDVASASNTERYEITSGVTDFRWVMKDVPALKEETYTSSLENHIAKIEFQLAERREPLVYKRIMGTWPDVTKELLEDEDFGAILKKDNNWLGETLQSITAAGDSKEDKAKKIYNFVRDNFVCSSKGTIYPKQSMKDVLKKRNGTVSELNMLLICLLRKADITADPVLMSTRGNAFMYSMYPLMERVNYLVVQTVLDNKTYYLDASEPYFGFGKLDYTCYNGHARVVNAGAEPLDFTADSLYEKKLTSIFLIYDKAEGFKGTLQQSLGQFESAMIRKKVKTKGEELVFADIKKAYTGEIELKEEKLNSLTNYDQALGIKYDINLKGFNEDIIYFNPLFAEGYKNNPFKSAERFYPVEMPYCVDETFLLRMDVPEGYQIDEMPKSVMLKLNEEGDGVFEYRIAVSGDAISLRSRLTLKRTYFSPDEYEMLREFFNVIVKKQNEQIVFKKK